MAKKKKNSRENDGASLDMTPMIDVVFQLIIFFVVTLKTADTINPDIVLEYGKNGPDLQDMLKENQATPPVTIEVRRYTTVTDFLRNAFKSRGEPVRTGCVISVNGGILTEAQLRGMLRNIISQRGTNFPLLIRADKDARHEDVRRVMDVCGGLGLWKISFVAMVKEGDSANKR